MLTNANLSTADLGGGQDLQHLATTPSAWWPCRCSTSADRAGRSAPCRAAAGPSSCATSTRPCCSSSIATERITEMFVVPAVLMLLLATPSLATTDLSSLRLIFYGASPISEDVLVKCMAAFGCGFCQVYGMTETTGAITALPFEDHDPDGPRRGLLRSAGKPHDSVSSCGSSTPTPAPTPSVGAVGEVWTRSPYNMAGYWGKPDETARDHRRRRLAAHGRRRLLRRRGLPLPPRPDQGHDRERGREHLPGRGRERAAVASRRSSTRRSSGCPTRGGARRSRPSSCSAPGATLDEAAVIAHCRANLAHYKCPTSVEAIDVAAAQPLGQDPQARAPGALLGRAGARHQLNAARDYVRTWRCDGVRLLAGLLQVRDLLALPSASIPVVAAATRLGRQPCRALSSSAWCLLVSAYRSRGRSVAARERRHRRALAEGEVVGLDAGRHGQRQHTRLQRAAREQRVELRDAADVTVVRWRPLSDTPTVPCPLMTR